LKKSQLEGEGDVQQKISRTKLQNFIFRNNYSQSMLTVQKKISKIYKYYSFDYFDRMV